MLFWLSILACVLLLDTIWVMRRVKVISLRKSIQTKYFSDSIKAQDRYYKQIASNPEDNEGFVLATARYTKDIQYISDQILVLEKMSYKELLDEQQLLEYSDDWITGK